MCLYVHTHIYIRTTIKWVSRKAGPLHFHVFSACNRNKTADTTCAIYKNWTSLTSNPLDRLCFSHCHFSFLPKSVCSKSILLGHTFNFHATNPSPFYTVLKWLNLVPDPKTRLALLKSTLQCTRKPVCSCGVARPSYTHKH